MRSLTQIAVRPLRVNDGLPKGGEVDGDSLYYKYNNCVDKSIPMMFAQDCRVLTSGNFVI